MHSIASRGVSRIVPTANFQAKQREKLSEETGYLCK